MDYEGKYLRQGSSYPDENVNTQIRYKYEYKPSIARTTTNMDIKFRRLNTFTTEELAQTTTIQRELSALLTLRQGSSYPDESLSTQIRYNFENMPC